MVTTQHTERITQLEREVKKLKDLLNVHDNWNSTIRLLIDHEILVCDRSGITRGVLKWSDRYNLCMEVAVDQGPRKLRVYTKGGINWIQKV